MASVPFGAKARMLEQLSPLLTKAQIPPLVSFSLGQWRADRAPVLAAIRKAFPDGLVAVRSSARSEDACTGSRAGEFHSELNVPARTKALPEAVDAVCAALPGDPDGDHFFVQAMAENVRMSGVVFSRDQDTLAPYMIFNYDDKTASTDTVTSGSSNNLTTLVVHREARPTDPDLARLADAVFELEELCGSTRLDVEFAMAKDGALFILQVRPLADKACESAHDDACVAEQLRKARKKLDKLMNPHPHLQGGTTFFGVMPDWNPAEIIGIRPRKLALSLYKELITDSVWAHQRYKYGYRDLRSFPLMTTFLGVPFIDIRASFNSFVPRSLPDGLAHKLVDHYMSHLEKMPELHDKVEFDVVFSCYFLGLPERLAALEDAGFNKNELKRIEFSLLELTNRIIAPDNGLFQDDMAQPAILKQRFQAIADSNLSVIEKIYWLLKDCKRYGTLPFAGVARSAFVAMQILRSFVDAGILSGGELDAYLNSLHTVSKRLTEDIHRFHKRRLAREDFLREYGHLRPGTYDILSPRYDANFNVYFGVPANGAAPEPTQSAFAFSGRQLTTLDAHLAENGIQCSAREMLDFIRRSIEGREHSKFVFTRSLSLALELVAELGGRFGLSREDLSHLDIRTVLALYADLDHRNMTDILGSDITTNRDYYSLTRSIRLPHLIMRPEDVEQWQEMMRAMKDKPA